MPKIFTLLLRSTPNQGMKWIPEPVALFAFAKSPPEPLTTYAGR